MGVTSIWMVFDFNGTSESKMDDWGVITPMTQDTTICWRITSKLLGQLCSITQLPNRRRGTMLLSLRRPVCRFAAGIAMLPGHSRF